MNEKKLQRLIDDAAELLHLDEKQRDYLDMLVNLSYNMGHLEGSKEGAKNVFNSWQQAIDTMAGKGKHE